jgi:hypothetical protein
MSHISIFLVKVLYKSLSVSITLIFLMLKNSECALPYYTYSFTVNTNVTVPYLVKYLNLLSYLFHNFVQLVVNCLLEAF